jgi:hypothetical protein
VEAGSNTSTVALRVVGGDKKGSVESESKIWSLVPRDSDPRMNALARASSSCKLHTHPLVRGCYIRTITAGVQLRKNLVVSLKGLGAKTN